MKKYKKYIKKYINVKNIHIRITRIKPMYKIMKIYMYIFKKESNNSQYIHISQKKGEGKGKDKYVTAIKHYII